MRAPFRRASSVLPLAALLAASATLLLPGCGAPPAPTPPEATGVPAAAKASDPVARGRYLAKAGDCAACHTTENGAPFAGGFELVSPFGTFYGTNITPDKEHGIGRWSADDFYKAMHDGVTPSKHLYPAMPYTSYRGMTRADSDAIYAYLMQLKPAKVANKEPELHFPYNMRFGVRFFNAAFLEDGLPDASQGTSARWQRGRYLSNVLGHCAECHTPREFPGRLSNARPMQGSDLGRIVPPDITPAGLAARGWTLADVQRFLSTGLAPQGSAYGEMYPVVHLSMQHLVPDDTAAIATYLLGDTPPAPQPLAPPPADAETKFAAGRQSYVAVCAGCHGLNGEGKPHVAVAMRGNSTLRNADAHNLIVSMLDGIAAQKFPGTEHLQEMPGFAATLSDAELAQLSNYLRVVWGGQPDNVSADQVKALRAGAGTH